jgi:hypothetical protein
MRWQALAGLLLCSCSVGLDEYTYDLDDCEPGKTLNDGFDGTELGPCWRLLEPKHAEVVVTDGQLEIVPEANTEWTQTGTGPFVYQLVDDLNFGVKITVAVQGEDPSGPPGGDGQGAGLMIRHASNPDSFVRYDLGRHVAGAGTESADTLHGAAATVVTPFAGYTGQLLMCRTEPAGDRIAVARRVNEGDEWLDPQGFERADLAGRIQVGLEAHCPGASCDLRAIFDKVEYVRLEDGDDAEDCRLKTP